MNDELGRIRVTASVGCVMLMAYFSAMVAGAQTTTGTVTGQVIDSTRAIIANATVSLINVENGVSIPTQSNRDGVYTVRFLPIGRYKVTTVAAGFSAKSSEAFSLEINQTIKIDTILAVGAATNTIDVTTDAPILDTTDATISTTFTNNEIQSLPLEGRNFQSVALFTPGVVNTDPSGMTGANATERSTTSNNLISVNGNRGQANYYTLDGVDINEPQNNQVSYNPAPDSLQEIKVISGNAPAIYGNVNGGDIVTVLKSGSNTFHGSGYGYLQNWRFNADSWGNKYQTPIVDRQHYTQSIFGGTFGGPIRIPHLFNGRDKLFFFGDYEGSRRPGATTSTYQVLTPAMLKGDFSAIPFQLYNTQAYDAATNTYPAFPNNQIPVNNPVAKFLAANPQYYPAPNAAAAPGSYLPQYQGSARTYVKNNQFDAKVDWAPKGSDRISGFYAQSRASDNSSGNVFPIQFPAVNSYPTTLFGASWVHTFSPSIVNQVNIGFTRTNWNSGIPIDQFGTFGLNGDQKVGIPFGIQRYAGFTGMQISGASTIGNQAAPQLLIDNTFQYNDNFTLSVGKHLITLGVQAVRYQQNYTQSQNAGALGFFHYSGVYTQNPNSANPNPQIGSADFVLDASNQNGLQDGGEFGNRQWRAAGYLQDDWRLNPKLTLNLGLRYEYDQPMVEANNKNANIIPLNGGTIEYAKAIPVGAPAGSIVCPTTACYNPNYRQIMPRLGFAYQAAPNISVRGGYGATRFFEGDAANQRLTDNPPLVSIFSRNSVQPSAGSSGGAALGASQGFVFDANSFQPSGSGFSAWPQNIQPAYIQQYNVTVETSLNSSTLLSIGYVGQSGQHLMDYGNENQFTQAQAFDINVNQPTVLPTSDLTPYYNLPGAGNGGSVLVTESRAKSSYNGMQVTLRQRQRYGLEYNLNYTWAKSKTNAAGNYGVPNSEGGDQTFQDYYNSQADYGVSGDDVRNQFNALVVYAIPYGHGRHFGGSTNKILDEALGGWSITNSFKAFTGIPVTIFANGGNTGSYGSERANQYSQMRIVDRSINHWFGTDPSAAPCTDGSGTPGVRSCAYGQPSTYAFGTAANGTERSPGFYQLDTSVFKDFRVFREQTFGFHADIFNVLNVADYGNPDGNIQSSTFGLINSVRNQERRMQLSLNYKF